MNLITWFRITARVLVVVGVILVALGHCLDGWAIMHGSKIIRHRSKRLPNKWEVFKTGLDILFSSTRFGLVGV